jgi:hypothetical protein
MDNITVQIECKGEYDKDIYVDASNCYLARALKEAGYQDVSVGANGRVRIGKTNYIASIVDKTNRYVFWSGALKDAFDKQTDLIVELT